MATFEIKMPKLGESITEGTIISWSVKVGDTVEEDDVLFEVSTAKVSAEIPSPVEGKVKQLLFNEGDTVAVGTVVAILEIEGEGEDNGAQPETSEATQPKEQVPAPASEELSKNSQEEDRWYSPVVLQLAKAAGVSQDELDHIPGTGYLGRLSKKDIQTYIDHKNKGTEMPKPKQAPVSSMQQTATSTPIITVAPPTAPSMPMTAATPSAPLAQGDEVREMDRVRKIIADHMVLSKKVSPHVTSVIEVDVTRPVNWRKKVKDQFFKQEGINLTYMPAITEATAKALKAYPLVNSSVDGYNIIFAWDELKDLARENMDSARGILLDKLCNYQGMKQIEVIAVFDAYRVIGHETECFDYHNIHVVFTKEAETADQYIEKFAHTNASKYQVTVATSDGLEQVIIRGEGCRLLSARDLHAEMELAGKQLSETYMQESTTKNRLIGELLEAQKKNGAST